MTLKEAMQLFATAEHYGVSYPDIDGMTDKEIIEAAKEMDLHSEYEYDAWKERFT
jgi:hypothetical protein